MGACTYAKHYHAPAHNDAGTPFTTAFMYDIHILYPASKFSKFPALRLRELPVPHLIMLNAKYRLSAVS